MPSHSVLEILDEPTKHKFALPVKRIHDGPDVSFFLSSLAYRDIMTFVLQLNHSMVPRISEHGQTTVVQTWELDSTSVPVSEPIHKLRQLISKLDSFIDEVPPDTGPRRFGNVSFRKWFKLVEGRLPELLKESLPAELASLGRVDERDETPALSELQVYLTGSFGSPQRLDYGTGHELSFIAFLGALWKLGFFRGQGLGEAERGIVIGLFEPYLDLVRRLMKSYTLEPAGSHGVWGLDDNSFLPYMFGSAQLAPAIRESSSTPIEGSVPQAPDPSSVSNRSFVQRERVKNMYFSAIGFIYDVKKGPFGEHSPMLHDISGITAGWGKINKGMIKMYNAEVLSKFPVVQHFPFGSLFRWEKDPDAVLQSLTAHDTSQHLRESSRSNPSLLQDVPGHSIRQSVPSAIADSNAPAPWATAPSRAPLGIVDGVTRAPWASTTKPPPPPPGRMRPS